MDGRQYLRHITVLLSGAGSAQIIAFVSYALLARLYEPAEFGTFALFATASTVIAIVAAFRFEVAIPLATRQTRVAILWLCTWLALFMGIAAGAVSAALLEDLLLPPALAVSVFLTSFVSASSMLLLRLERYRSVAASMVARTGGAAAVQIALGFAIGGERGLIFGYAAGLILQGLIIAMVLRGTGALFWPRRRHVAAAMRRFRRQSLIDVPSALLHRSSSHVLNVTLLVLYGEAVVGYYALAQRLVGAPLQTVNDALARVFFQKAAAAQERTGSFWPEMRYNLLLSTSMSTAVLAAIWILAPPLIPLYLGQDWYPTATILVVLAPMLTVRSVAMTISTSVFVLGRPQWRLYDVLALLTLHLAAFATTAAVSLDVFEYLTLTAVLLGLQHLIFVSVVMIAARATFKTQHR